MGILGDILAIKTLREERAETAMRRQQAVLAGAHRDQEQLDAELVEFRQVAVRREATAYRELCSRVVSLRDIEEVQQLVVQLRAGEQSCMQRCKDAADRVREAAAQLEELMAVHQEAARMKEKFVELLRSHDEQQAQDALRHEDLEMEEVADTGHRRSAESDLFETADEY